MHQHSFRESSRSGYEICTQCGTYHSTCLEKREILYENDYWSHKNNRSTLEEQVYNLTETKTSGISKIEKILSRIPDSSRVLEIACAPGVMIRELIKKKCEVVGIEPDENNISTISGIIGSGNYILINGYFPECMDKETQPFDVIVSMDCVEHIEDYDTFIRSAYDLLKEGGSFIFMSPIHYDDGLFREIDFVPEEHAWLFSQQYLSQYLNNLFSAVIFDRWIVGHELVICKKR